MIGRTVHDSLQPTAHHGPRPPQPTTAHSTRPKVFCLCRMTAAAAAALASLEKAVAAGYSNKRVIEKDEDLDALRKLERFQQIIFRI